MRRYGRLLSEADPLMLSMGRFAVVLGLLLGLMACKVPPGMTGNQTEVHLSPEVNGVVMVGGHPAKGARVVRTLDYDQEYREETLTNDVGAFHFPEKAIQSSRPGKLLDETRVRQIVTVTYQGEKYLLWYSTPGTIHWRTGIASRLSSMQCELTNPETEQGFKNVEKPRFPHSTFSVCRW